MANEIIFSNDDFYISFTKERPELAKALDNFVATFDPNRQPKNLPETALCVRSASKRSGLLFYILYGDHRTNYKALVPDLDKCIGYFKDNIDQISHSSEVPEATQ